MTGKFECHLQDDPYLIHDAVAVGCGQPVLNDDNVSGSDVDEALRFEVVGYVCFDGGLVADLSAVADGRCMFSAPGFQPIAKDGTGGSDFLMGAPNG